MNEYKSTITSKGQITLPKTIRDVMSLSAGDQITFTIESDKKVIMEKAEYSIKNQSKMNLISLLLNYNLPIVIKGGSGVGKTFLSKSYLINQCTDKKVVVIEPFSEYKELESNSNITCYCETKYIDNEFLEAQYGDYELVVIDYSSYYNFDSIVHISLSPKKLILISQDFSEKELLELRSHILITLNDVGGMVIDHYEYGYNNFEVKTIYVD